MYLTQTSFLGKTGVVPKTISEALNERSYPNHWMEERNLKSLH